MQNAIRRDFFYLLDYVALGTNGRRLKWPTGFLKVCDWPLRPVSGGQSQTLKSIRPKQQSPGQVMAGRGDVGPGSSDGRAPDM